MQNRYDVIVAGLGPAGATAAYYLAKSGVSVLALDKAKFPRIKPCGGGITAKGIRATEVDWLSCVESEAHRVKLTYRYQSPLEFTNPTPIVYMVARPTFDHYLVKQAEKQGAVIRQNERIKIIVQDLEKVTVVTEKGTYIARYLVGADGALGVVRRQILKEEIKKKFFIAAETESCPYNQNVSCENNEIYFHLDSTLSGYGWVFGKGIYQSVGVYGSVNKTRNPVDLFRTFVNQYANHVKGNHVPIRVHPVPGYLSQNHMVAKDRVLFVGDAARLVDPLLGEGIYYALTSGRIAGEIISQNINSRDKVADLYQHMIDEEIGRELTIAEKLANLIYSFPSLSFWLFQSYPKIFSDFCRVLAGTQSYQEFTNELKEELLLRKPVLSRLLLGTNRLRVLLSIN